MFSEDTELSKVRVDHPLAKASSETGPLQLADEQSTAETHKTLNWPSWYQTIPLPWLTCGLAGCEVLISKVAHIDATADALHVDQLGAEHSTSDPTQRKHPSSSCFPPRAWGVPHSKKHPFVHKGAQQGPLPKRGSRTLLQYSLITIVILISLGNTESTWRFSTEICSEHSNLSAPQLWWWKCCLHWIKVPTPSLLIRWPSPATMQCILPFQHVLSGCTTLAPKFQTQLSEPPWTLRRNTGTFLVAKLSDVTWTPYLNTHTTACN